MGPSINCTDRSLFELKIGVPSLFGSGAIAVQSGIRYDWTNVCIVILCSMFPP